MNKLNLILAITAIMLSAGVASLSADAVDTEEYLNHKCATFTAYTVNHRNNQILTQDWPKDQYGRPLLQDSVFSKSGRFLIHYDTVNLSPDMINAVPMQDLDQNGIPDYVDSAAYYLDYAHHLYVDSMGYLSPILDQAHGGKGHIDIYLVNCGNGPGAFYGQTGPDNTFFSTSNFERYTSYIILDNDFSTQDSLTLVSGKKVPTYREFGINALKITAAHELHHAIQFIYGIVLNPSTEILNEMSSTYMESRLFPQTTDYVQFVISLFKNLPSYPFGVSDPNSGYRWAIFGQYMNRLYGDSLLKRMWELTGQQISGYKALDSAFAERGSSLAAAWCDFMPWLYYTGSRARDGMYFATALSYPLMSPNDTLNFTPPSSLFDGSLRLYEVHFLRTIFHSTSNDQALDCILSNDDTPSTILAIRNTKNYTFLASGSPSEGYTQIGATPYYYKLVFPQDYICPTLFVDSSQVIDYVYPDPYRPAASTSGSGARGGLNFPVPQHAIAGDKAYLRIFNTALNEVFNINLIIGNDNKNHLIVNCASIPEDLGSGVYFYEVQYKNSSSMGKFTIIR